MTEKNNKLTSSSTGTMVPGKPVPMKLFATWEVDRTPSNCIPRLCSLRLTRLVVLRPLGADLTSISIAVRMQSSKRTLRSNELLLPPNGLLDTSLELTFSLQYPHFLKRDGNKLHVLLQRKKRYKNRTMLGFKTLAEGIIRMDHVLQKQMDLELELLAEGSSKDKGATPVARVTVQQLTSLPVDQDHKGDREREFSDEEDEFSSGEEEAADLSDSEPLRPKLSHPRHNLKQRFVSLLKRFRVADTEVGRNAALANPSEIQALFQELESLSCEDDSGPEQDTMSISSTPKPSLRPFFSSSRSLLEGPTNICMEMEKVEDKNYSGSDGNAGTDQEVHSDPQTGSPPKDKTCLLPQKSGTDIDSTEVTEKKSKLFRSSNIASKKKSSLSIGTEPVSLETAMVRKSFQDQVFRQMSVDEIVLPECVALVVGAEPHASVIISRLPNHYRIFQPLSAAEVKILLTALVTKINKHCSSCAKPSSPVKILLVGGDSLVSWFIRPYVELLSNKPPEWLLFLRLYVVPLGTNLVARNLAAQDSGYAALFPPDQEIKVDDLIVKIQRYLSIPASAPTAQLSLAEAMLTCHDDSSQVFIPFINEVRVGPLDNALSISVDLDDTTCSSPPSAPPALTPPSSPNVQNRESPWEPLELQLDYWQASSRVGEPQTKSEKQPKQDGKVSLKGLFRGLQVTPCLGLSPSLCLTMHVASKEKKQKIMRLGKKKEKEREIESRSQTVEGVSRLICSAKSSHSTTMRLFIDGTEWSCVKFFQLSSTWQTHVKNLPVALVGVPLASQELP
ncbi:phosphofurin acidic cluster sorting protein 1 [Agrilus planipennis]|uniref:Phosphofurin acidic cluster sorting protein 1 n=1 Tax=Agrilus planipennis TaxID=224129 RepID=A0A7F5RCZ7_AGRPL|nr:phosphofurin acidic cluster sorting protein 1 [Agrilus planipennis]